MKLGSALCFFAWMSLLGVAVAPAWADEGEEFYCEVMAVTGTVYLSSAEVYGKVLSEGDLLKVDDEIETSEGSTVDLAFDRDWSNVTRVEEKTKMKIRAVFPTRLFLDRGALYAKLKSLPKDSVFQVETPTAIAAVRGTEYRTEYDGSETTVSNDSEAETSKVYVYEPHESGELKGEPTVLPRTQFTGVRPGSRPHAPKPMTAVQQRHCQNARAVLEHKIRENVSRGRVGKIQDLRKMEARGQQLKEARETQMKRQAGERPNRERNLRRSEFAAGGPGDPPGGSGGPRGNREPSGERWHLEGRAQDSGPAGAPNGGPDAHPDGPQPNLKEPYHGAGGDRHQAFRGPMDGPNRPADSQGRHQARPAHQRQAEGSRPQAQSPQGQRAKPARPATQQKRS